MKFVFMFYFLKKNKCDPVKYLENKFLLHIYTSNIIIQLYDNFI